MPSSAVTEATSTILQAGITGALCIIFGVVIIMLWRDGKEQLHTLLGEIKDAQNKRIAEAQETQKTLMSVVDRCTTALMTTAAATEQQRETMIEIRNAIKELSSEVRKQP